MESLHVKIEELDKWRSIEKNVPSSTLEFKTYDIRIHALSMSESQELDSKFEEKARQNVVGIMELYEKSIYDVQRYSQSLEIKLEDEHVVSFSFFQELKDKFEKIKEEVHAKEVISKEYIQDLLIKLSMEYSHYTTFLHKFVISMDKFK